MFYLYLVTNFMKLKSVRRRNFICLRLYLQTEFLSKILNKPFRYAKFVKLA